MDKPITVEEVEALKKALEAGESDKPTVEGSAMTVLDIDDAVLPHLFASVKEALSKKVMHTHDHDYKVRYFGIKAPTIESTAAGEALAKIVNKACRTYQVVGSLGTCIKYDLAWGAVVDTSGEPKFFSDQPESLYLCYIAFTPEAAEAISETSMAGNFQEGGIPSIDLPKEDYQFDADPFLEKED